MPRASKKVEDSSDRFCFERQFQSQGYLRVAGVDEAGRGPLAGPVVAACVLLPDFSSDFFSLDDSKKLTESKREQLYTFLNERALAIGVGVVDAQTIDRINILQATFLAMQKAVENITPKPDFILIDGNRRPTWATAAETIVKGDSRSISIAAASIIAKVTRDRMMEEYAQLFPQWGFLKHKGYGTADHIAAIHEHGVSPIHRRTFAPISQMTLL